MDSCSEAYGNQVSARATFIDLYDRGRIDGIEGARFGACMGRSNSNSWLRIARERQTIFTFTLIYLERT